jgi:hypothetical protein
LFVLWKLSRGREEQTTETSKHLGGCFGYIYKQGASARIGDLNPESKLRESLGSINQFQEA